MATIANLWVQKASIVSAANDQVSVELVGLDAADLISQADKGFIDELCEAIGKERCMKVHDLIENDSDD